MSLCRRGRSALPSCSRREPPERPPVGTRDDCASAHPRRWHEGSIELVPGFAPRRRVPSHRVRPRLVSAATRMRCNFVRIAPCAGAAGKGVRCSRMHFVCNAPKATGAWPLPSQPRPRPGYVSGRTGAAKRKGVQLSCTAPTRYDRCWVAAGRSNIAHGVACGGASHKRGLTPCPASRPMDESGDDRIDACRAGGGDAIASTRARLPAGVGAGAKPLRATRQRLRPSSTRSACARRRGHY